MIITVTVRTLQTHSASRTLTAAFIHLLFINILLSFSIQYYVQCLFDSCTWTSCQVLSCPVLTFVFNVTEIIHIFFLIVHSLFYSFPNLQTRVHLQPPNGQEQHQSCFQKARVVSGHAGLLAWKTIMLPWIRVQPCRSHKSAW